MAKLSTALLKQLITITEKKNRCENTSTMASLLYSHYAFSQAILGVAIFPKIYYETQGNTILTELL